MMKHKCLYCGRMKKDRDEPCLGCGRTEIKEKENKHVSERFHDGYFVKSISGGPVEQSMEYFFFRGEKLVDRIKIGWRDWMLLKEAEGLDDGVDGFYLIWRMFRASQERKFGVFKTYENDPTIKRIEVRVVPWNLNGRGRGYADQAGPTGSVDGLSTAAANWNGINQLLGGIPPKPSGELKRLIRKSVGLDA